MELKLSRRSTNGPTIIIVVRRYLFAPPHTQPSIVHVQRSRWAGVASLEHRGAPAIHRGCQCQRPLLHCVCRRGCSKFMTAADRLPYYSYVLQPPAAYVSKYYACYTSDCRLLHHFTRRVLTLRLFKHLVSQRLRIGLLIVCGRYIGARCEILIGGGGEVIMV